MNTKTAVVVGGTGNIGSAIVKYLLCRNYKVICITRVSPSRQMLVREVDYLFGDMTKIEQINDCVKLVFSKYNSVDLLINTIGKNVTCSLEDINEEIWQEVMDSNLKSVFFICRAFGENMIKSETGGSIINFSSTAGIRALPQSPHYIAAKAGVIAISQFFASIYAPKIRVNCIAPGFVLTENHQKQNYMKYDDIISCIPALKMSSIDEIANAVIFLAQSETITGHTLIIDGGLVL